MNWRVSKRIGTSIMVFLIMVCFIASTVGAFVPGEGRHDKGPHWYGHQRCVLGIWQDPQMVHELGLTTDQVKQLRDADFSFREKRLALEAQLESLQLQMDKAFSNDVIDDTAVLTLAEKISDVKGKLFVQHIESRLAVGKLLNTNQINKLKLHALHQKNRGPRDVRKCISKRDSSERRGDRTLSEGLNE